MRGFKGQALALFGQHGLQLGQRGASAHGDDQLAGLVAHDAAQHPGVEHLAVQRQAMEVLGAPATDAQRGLVGGGSAHALSDRGEGEVHPCIVAAAVGHTAGEAREFFEQRVCKGLADATGRVCPRQSHTPTHSLPTGTKKARRWSAG